MDNLLRGNEDRFQGESVHLTKTGKVFPVEISLTSANIKGQPMLLGVVRDISERKQAEKAIWHQAHYDALTGLPNRFYYNQLLDNALKQARIKEQKCAVIFLDLDQFNLINDSLGHNRGDQLLQLVAKRMKSLGLQGTFGRPGGDEFVILLPELKHAEEAASVAEKIIEAFEAPFYIEENEVFITASLGIGIFPDDAEDHEILLKLADTAMYHAKELGRNNYKFFINELNETIQKKAALAHLMRKALERGEFHLHYQPQVDIQTGRIKGMEALLRWTSPVKGEVSPGVFIPIAEETGLIVPIGAWVLRSACAQNVKWQKMGYLPLAVSINISSRQFREPMFIESVAEVLEETGLDPRWLEIEITESIVMENVESTNNQLKRLRELGVTVAIDDFGTGYSSLNYLRKLPFDTLKIDQSFVQDIGRNENGEAIVIAIIQLASNLHLKVIAEGVETEGQLAFLKAENCQEMQGYLFSKPLPSGELEENLKREKVSFA
jgi:diguanylate cyclase (GGDEF)-like protein